MTSPYTSLPDGKWQQLLAHGALLRAERPYLGSLRDQSSTMPVVQTALLDMAVAAVGAVDSTMTDDQVIATASREWAAALNYRLSRPGITAVESQIIAELRGALPAATGDPFAALFSSITTLSEEVYGADWPSAQLDIAWMPDHPRGSSDPYGVAACVERTSLPTVELQVHLGSFGPAAYCAIPSLLVHECICHAPAKHSGGDFNQSTFAEGFMDWAAQFFFDRWRRLIDSELAPAAKEHALAMDAVVSGAQTPPAAARRFGRRVADKVATVFVTKSGLTPDEADMATARLAVDLNRCAKALRAKDLFVAAIDGMPADGIAGLLSPVIVGRSPAWACSLL